jgi:hypothetical protein
MTAQKEKKKRSNGGAVLNDTTELYYIIWLSTCVVCTHLMMSRFFRILQTCDMHKSVLRTWFHTYKHTYYCASIKWLLLRRSFYTIQTNDCTEGKKKKKQWWSSTKRYDWAVLHNMTEYVRSMYALDDVTIFPSIKNSWHAQICTTHVIPYVHAYVILRFD